MEKQATQARIDQARGTLRLALGEMAKASGARHASPHQNGRVVMSDDTDAQMVIYGKLLALEAMAVQTAWCWAVNQPHPPTALSKWLRPLEEQFATMRADAGNHPVAMAAAVETVQGVGKLLEQTLLEESLRRATPESSGRN